MTEPRPLPTNDEIAERFLLLASLLEEGGAERHRVLAYRRAAGRVTATETSVAEMALKGAATDLPSIGEVLQKKIVELVETGDISALARLRDAAPPAGDQVTPAPG
jgi:DNA polymerase (family X)